MRDAMKAGFCLIVLGAISGRSIAQSPVLTSARFAAEAAEVRDVQAPELPANAPIRAGDAAGLDRIQNLMAARDQLLQAGEVELAREVSRQIALALRDLAEQEIRAAGFDPSLLNRRSEEITVQSSFYHLPGVTTAQLIDALRKLHPGDMSLLGMPRKEVSRWLTRSQELELPRAVAGVGAVNARIQLTLPGSEEEAQLFAASLAKSLGMGDCPAISGTMRLSPGAQGMLFLGEEIPVCDGVEFRDGFVIPHIAEQVGGITLELSGVPQRNGEIRLAVRTDSLQVIKNAAGDGSKTFHRQMATQETVPPGENLVVISLPTEDEKPGHPVLMILTPRSLPREP